jgi:hypothetical protein
VVSAPVRARCGGAVEEATEYLSTEAHAETPLKHKLLLERTPATAPAIDIDHNHSDYAGKWATCVLTIVNTVSYNDSRV